MESIQFQGHSASNLNKYSRKVEVKLLTFCSDFKPRSAVGLRNYFDHCCKWLKLVWYKVGHDYTNSFADGHAQ